MFSEDQQDDNQNDKVWINAKKDVKARNYKVFLHKQRLSLLEKLEKVIPNIFEDFGDENMKVVLLWLQYLQVLLLSHQSRIEDELKVLVSDRERKEERLTPMFVHKVPSKEEIKAKVFTSYHRPPTMTMDEFIEREILLGNIQTTPQTMAKKELREEEEIDIYTLRRMDEYKDGK